MGLDSERAILPLAGNAAVSVSNTRDLPLESVGRHFLQIHRLEAAQKSANLVDAPRDKRADLIVSELV